MLIFFCSTMPKRDRSSDSDSFSNNRRRHHSPEGQVGENLHESATIIDRDGRRHIWRDSRNISERTKNLEVPFRVISHRRIPLFFFFVCNRYQVVQKHVRILRGKAISTNNYIRRQSVCHVTGNRKNKTEREFKAPEDAQLLCSGGHCIQDSCSNLHKI